MLSITPSKLEVFRKYIHEEYNGWFTEEKVIEQIMGTQKSSFKANLGTAIHEILEKGYERYFDGKTGLYSVKVRVKDQPDEVFEFKPLELTTVMEYVNTHKSAIHEVPLEMNLEVNGHEVLIRMKIDQIMGVSVTDHKTSDKEPKHDDFEASLQWRIYLLATQAKFFTYNHFQYRWSQRGKKGDLSIIRREFPLYPYEKMLNEVKGWIQHFIIFCEKHDLMDYIQYKEPKGVV